MACSLHLGQCVSDRRLSALQQHWPVQFGQLHRHHVPIARLLTLPILLLHKRNRYVAAYMQRKCIIHRLAFTNLHCRILYALKYLSVYAIICYAYIEGVFSYVYNFMCVRAYVWVCVIFMRFCVYVRERDLFGNKT